jgi:enamine deaminase RidA (YjgF/YER057c/UK114 family)
MIQMTKRFMTYRIILKGGTDKQIRYLNPDSMPTPSGYSHVVEVRNGRTIYVSGQVALTKEGELVGKGDLKL